MMNFAEFVSEVKSSILGYLPEEYADVNVSTNEVNKNNGLVLTGLIIPSLKSNVTPNIYLDDFYSKYEDGESVEDICREIADVRIKHEAPSFDVESVTEWGNVKDRICPRLINAASNASILAQRPSRLIEDLAITYCINLGSNENGSMSIPVTNQIMEDWGVTEEVLYATGKANLKTLTPASFKSMKEVMIEMMGTPAGEMEDMIDMMPDNGMYVLTNEQKMNGASVIIDEDVLNNIQTKLGEGFYIIPSSIHEVLVIPESMGMGIEEMNCMINEVNTTQIGEQDVLSDHVYYYGSEKILQIPNAA